MPEGVYDREGIRILAEALNIALLDIEAHARRRLGETEKADFAQRITRGLLDAFDIGERNPETLKQVALAAIKYPVDAEVDGNPRRTFETSADGLRRP